MDLLAVMLSSVAVVLLIWLLARSFGANNNANNSAFVQAAQTMQNSALRISEQFTQRLDALGSELGQLRQIGMQIENFQRLMLAPKYRGDVGEMFLEQLLAEVLPKEFYRLQDVRLAPDLRPDAVIYAQSGMVPVDAKFPHQNFAALFAAKTQAEREVAAKALRADIRRHVDAVAKYVLPSAGTSPFALMFVPSESVFGYILENEPQLLREAQNKRVLLVSPNSLYYFLNITLISLKQKIAESRAEKIFTRLEGVALCSQKMNESLDKLIKQLLYSQRNADELKRAYEELNSRIDKLAELEHEE